MSEYKISNFSIVGWSREGIPFFSFFFSFNSLADLFLYCFAFSFIYCVQPSQFVIPKQSFFFGFEEFLFVWRFESSDCYTNFLSSHITTGAISLSITRLVKVFVTFLREVGLGLNLLLFFPLFVMLWYRLVLYCTKKL